MSFRVVSVVGFGLVALFIVQQRPIDDFDIFWQVRFGQLMLEHGRLVTSDPFTYTHAGSPVPPVGWLAQLVFAWCYRLGGWFLVRLFHALLFAGAFAVAASIGARARSAGTTLIANAFGLLAALSSCSVRPQSFALFGFASLLAVAASRMRPAKKLLVGSWVAVIWQNAHPSLIVGFLVLSVLAVVAWLGRSRLPPNEPLWSKASLALVTGLAQLATPLGATVFEFSRTNAKVAHTWLRSSEWMPAWDESVRAAVEPFWALLLLCVVLIPISVARRKLSQVPHPASEIFQVGRAPRRGSFPGSLGTDAAVMALLTSLVFFASRFVIFWAVAFVPIAGGWLEASRSPARQRSTGPTGMSFRFACALLLPLAILALALPAYGAVHRSLFDREIPVAAIGRLEQVLPAGRVYAYREWGGPLLFEGGARWRVALDGRLCLFKTPDEWNQYHRAALGEVPLAELAMLHRPDAFVLETTFHRGLVTLLRASNDWEEVYGDSLATIFVKRRDGKKRSE